MEEAVREELGRYRSCLEEAGLGALTVRGYVRELGHFLERCPGALGAEPGDAAAMVAEYVGATAADPCAWAISSSLHRWASERLGVDMYRPRRDPSGYATSRAIEEEAEAFGRALEADGLTAEVVRACSVQAAMFLGWLFPGGAVDLAEVTPEAVVRYIASECAPLGRGTRKQYASRLRRYLRFVDSRTGRRASALPVAQACWGGPMPRAATEEEVEALLAPGDPGDPRASRARAAVALMCNLGLRCCEAAALRLADVDFAGAAVSVPTAKGGPARRLPLDAQTGSALAEYVVRHRPRAGSGALFLVVGGPRDGEPMSASQLRYSLRSHARRRGVADFGTHMLRRRAATRLVAAGAGAKVVADMLGHADVQTTRVYLRLDMAGLLAAAGPWPGGGGADE